MINYFLLSILSIYILTSSLSCSKKEDRRDEIWESVGETIHMCVGLDKNKISCCDEINPKLDQLDKLGAEPFQTDSYRIKCHCMKRNYPKAISIAEKLDDQFWVGSLHYFFVDKAKGEKILRKVYEKYRERDYLEEVELGIYMRTITLLTIEMSYKEFVEHVKKKELLFEDQEQLFKMIGEMPTKDEIKRGICSF